MNGTSDKVAADVCFKVGHPGIQQVDIPAHKHVLQVKSAVFEAMFSNRWQVAGEEEEKKCIEIPDISPADFQEILRFIYCEEIQLEDSNVFQVLYGARKYQLLQLQAKCEGFIIKGIDTENVCSLLEQSLLIDEINIAEACMKFIEEDAMSVLESTGFLSLSKEALLHIVRDDKIDVFSEKLVYDACMKWGREQCRKEQVPCTTNNIKSALGEVLYCIRFPAMKHEELLSITQESDLLDTEEKINIYEMILGRNSNRVGGSMFPVEPRWKPGRKVYNVCINRIPMAGNLYSPVKSVISLKQLDGHIRLATTFCVDHLAFLTGIGVFLQPDLPQSTWTVSLLENCGNCIRIFNNGSLSFGSSSLNQSYSVLSKPILISRLDFSEVCEVSPNKQYSLLAECTYNEPCATTLTNCLSEQTCEDFKITFEYEHNLEHKTSIYGDIPVLYFRFIR